MIFTALIYRVQVILLANPHVNYILHPFNRPYVHLSIYSTKKEEEEEEEKKFDYPSMHSSEIRYLFCAVLSCPVVISASLSAYIFYRAV